MPTKKTKETIYSATSISDKLEGLFELQCVDSEIDKLKILRGQLPLEVIDLEEAIEKLNDRLQTQSDSELEFKNSITEQKQKIKDAKLLITKYDTQQEKVRNNREFDAISKELEFQGLEIELSNKKIKSLELELEENESKIKLLKAKIKERKKHLKNKKGELSVIIQSTEKEEKKLLTKKKKVGKKIEEKSVNAYHDIRLVSKNGLAVVKVQRDACGGCFSSITAQHHLNIKLRKAVLFCENCGRILVPDDIDSVS